MNFGDKIIPSFFLSFSICLSIGFSCSVQARKMEGGAGFVLLTSLMRNKVEQDPRYLMACPSDFIVDSAQDDSSWRTDIYVTNLSLPTPQFWTRADEYDSCISESKKKILERHPCLTETLDQALAQAKEMTDDLKRSYEAVSSDFNNATPKDMFYKLIIQSTDENLRYIDVYGWDFSWLTDWNPFYSEENTCPFRFELRHGIRLPDGGQEILQTYSFSL